MSQIGNFTEEKVIRNLIHGQQLRIAMNARKKKVQDPIDNDLADQPPDRIAELERRIQKLEDDVAVLKSVNPSPLLNEVVIEVEGKKRGRREKISDAVLFNYREGLILWLESAWPWLTDRLFTARTPEQVEAILEAIAEDPASRPDWQERLLQNAGDLLDFILHEKFRKGHLRSATVNDALTLPCNDEIRRRAANQFPTRQIANAMAGVPDISWTRSLDRCYANPSTVYFSQTTEMYYREMYSMPMPEERDLIGQRAPVPKPLQPISARPSNRAEGTSNKAIKATGGGTGSIAAGRGRAR